MRRLLCLLVLLVLAAPAGARADLTSTGSADVRVRDGIAVVDDAAGAWRVWDLRRGRVGPRHEGFCGASRLLEWGRDVGLKGAAFVAVSLEVVPVRAVGPPPAGDDPLCRTARAVLDRDGDGRSALGEFAVLRATELGRDATALPLVRLPAGQAPSSLAVRGSTLWLGVDGGNAYLKLERGATAWSGPVPADLRETGVEPDPTADTQLLDDGALWRWTWSDVVRRGRLQVRGARRRAVDVRPRSTFGVPSPVRGRRAPEPGSCPSPRRVSVFGPATAVVDGRGRHGWGITDGFASWRCGRGKDRATFGIGDLQWLVHTTDGGRRWRLGGRLPVDARLLGVVAGRPLFEHGRSACPRPLALLRGSRLTPVPCAG